jgi:hypothetical protein
MVATTHLKRGQTEINSDVPAMARNDFGIDAVEYVCKYFGDWKMD